MNPQVGHGLDDVRGHLLLECSRRRLHPLVHAMTLLVATPRLATP